jgi:hypothetical protein
MLKRTLLVLLAVMMCISAFAACAGETEQSSVADESKAESKSEGTESMGESSAVSTPEDESDSSDAVSEPEDSSEPDESTPDESTPDESKPDESEPDESEPDESEPDESKPDDDKTENTMGDYWGFNDYKTTDIVGAPEEITSFPTTIKKVSTTQYSMTSETDMGTVTVTLEERPWGCFNLWKWSLKTKDGKTFTFAPGGTDFEYVHIPVTPKGTNVWSGGNHGNEAFISLDIYNGETGEKIDLAVGKSVTVNSVHVIEKTKLLWFPDDNGDSIGDYNNKSMTYTDADVYAEMTRKYTFTGPQIKLNVDYKFVKDVTMMRSYTCMMPIDKKYGLWCEMYNEKGEMLKKIETLKVGAADYSGPSNSGNKACRALVYGYIDARYQIDVRVNTIQDSLDNYNGDFKTAYWDMNTNQNKLYFTRFSNSVKRNIKAGEEHHTESIWLLKFDPNAKTPEIKEPEYEKPEDFKCTGTLASLNKPYKLSGLMQTGGFQYTALLTDGKYVKGLTYDNNWFTFVNGAQYTGDKSNTENGYGYAIIDLGKKIDISGVRAHICNGGTSGINAPYEAKVFVSDDGVTFKQVATLKIAEDPTAIYWTGANLSNVSGRYVKFQFKCNGLFCFMNELEVYSK